MGRYAEPVELQAIKRYVMRGAPPKPKKLWKLETSIWAPRTKWADSRDFWDTEAVERRMFEKDWERVRLRTGPPTLGATCWRNARVSR